VRLGHETSILNFHARVGLVQIPQKARQDMISELVCLHPLRYVGHIVCSGASGAQNIDSLFFTCRWVLCGSDKKHVVTIYARVVFLHLVGFAG
jgi:hypothetical protein